MLHARTPSPSSSRAPGLFFGWPRWLAALALTGGLAACGGGSGSGSSDTGGATGELRMALTDAPACGFEHVYVTVERVRVHRNENAEVQGGGWSEIVLDPPERIDLLTLTNGVLHELGQTSLPAGTYTQIRLVLAANGGTAPYANAVVREGQTAESPLMTPSGQQSGLKLNAHVTVEANQRTDVVMDFDACRSVVVAGRSGNVLLKPVIAVLPWPDETGNGLRVEGHVAPALGGTGTSVSLQFNGVPVRSTQPNAGGHFILSPVPAGTYDLVIAAEGRVTAVMTDVPVSATGPTVVSTAGQAIVPPLATLREVRGTAEAEEPALVRALQTLSGGPTIERIARPADAEDGSYAFMLPLQAPWRAAWGATSAFEEDDAAAGQYTIEAALEEGPVQQLGVNLLDGAPSDPVEVDFVFAP